MNFEAFHAAISRGAYTSAAYGSTELMRLLAAHQREFSPSGPQYALLRRAAESVWPALSGILAVLRDEEKHYKGAARLCSLLLRVPEYRTQTIEQILHLLTAGAAAVTERNVAEALFYGPALPELQEAFGPRLLQICRQPVPHRVEALSAIGALEYEPGAPIAALAMRSDDNDEVLAGERYFRRVLNTYTVSLLQKHVRETDPSHFGWGVAVRCIAQAGLLAHSVADELLQISERPELPPFAKAFLAVCLTQICLSNEVAARALRLMRTILRDAIDESLRLSSRLRDNGAERPPESEQGMLCLIDTLAEHRGYRQEGLHDLSVEAIARGNSWAIRCRGADSVQWIQFPMPLMASLLLPALISALELVIEIGAWNPYHPGTCTPGSFTGALLDLANFGIDLQPARAVLCRYLDQVDPSVRDEESYAFAQRAYATIVLP